jgi:hypothetical protein
MHKEEVYPKGIPSPCGASFPFSPRGAGRPPAGRRELSPPFPTRPAVSLHDPSRLDLKRQDPHVIASPP